MINTFLELYREHYPSSQEESSEIEKEYPHKKEEITKVILTSKLKNIRLKFLSSSARLYSESLLIQKFSLYLATIKQ